MDIVSFLGTNFLNGLLAMILLLTGFQVFDRITPNWDFSDVFGEKGVSGGALVVAAFLLGLSYVIGAAAF